MKTNPKVKAETKPCAGCETPTDKKCERCGDPLCESFLCDYQAPGIGYDHICAVCYEEENEDA